MTTPVLPALTGPTAPALACVRTRQEPPARSTDYHIQYTTILEELFSLTVID